jgi:lipopolysaccharide export system protein LptA
MRQADSKGRKAWGVVLAAGLAAAALAAAGAAGAQLSNKKGPIDLTGDSMDVRDQEHLVVWKGRVEALQDGNRMRTDLLNIYYKSAAKVAGAPKTASMPGADFGDIDHMEAIGNVYFVTPTEIARGDKAVYTAATQTIVITGDVVLTRGEDVGRGSRLVIDLANNHSTLEGGGTGPVPRPRVIIYPRQQQTPQGKSR